MIADDFQEESIVPSGGFAFGAEAFFAGSGFDEIESHVFDGGHVFGTVFGSEAHEIVVEDDVEDPVEAVFDAPVGAGPWRRRLHQAPWKK